MISFFTTTKSFIDKNLVNQVNALRSWTVGNRFNCEVLVFQRSAGSEILGSNSQIRIIDTIRSNENGVPFINHMFCEASRLATHDIICFLNADIIINGEFITKLIDIHNTIQKEYLIVGQRIDVSFDHLIDFSVKDWYRQLENSLNGNIKVHPPLGSDFFCFPKGQYVDNSLPDLLVGRPGWDLYMIYNARKKKFKLVDLSPSCMVIHQAHDYMHKSSNEQIQKKEDRYNLNFLPSGEEYKYVLSYCNYLYINNRIVKSYHKLNYKKYYTQETNLYQLSVLYKFLLKGEIFLQRIRNKILRSLKRFLRIS